MIAKTTIGICVALLAFIAVPLSASAQNNTTQKPLKQIGVPESERTETVPSLIVLNARGATLNGTTLTLLGVASNAIIFADRPVRAAGHALTAHLLEDGPGSDSFGKDPPNATVSVLSKDGSTVKDAVVVLTSPKPEGDNLTFNVKMLEAIWPASTARRLYSSTSSVCPSRRCRLPALPGERRAARRSILRPRRAHTIHTLTDPRMALSADITPIPHAIRPRPNIRVTRCKVAVEC